jgi:hypothetical protein
MFRSMNLNWNRHLMTLLNFLPEGMPKFSIESVSNTEQFSFVGGREHQSKHLKIILCHACRSVATEVCHKGLSVGWASGRRELDRSIQLFDCIGGNRLLKMIGSNCVLFFARSNSIQYFVVDTNFNFVDGLRYRWVVAVYLVISSFSTLETWLR